ncbi:MAG: hypothetical protein RJA70_4033, partial [Pseudomonadota bacterium]
MPVDKHILELFPEVQRWRKEIHAHPELAFEERRTSLFVADRLKEAGLEVTQGIAETGVVATLRCGSGTGAIALRADIDALPLQEKNEFAHRSQHDGKMHACGHDGHTAMLLGAAHHLARTRDFSGTVHFVFQPAEEGGGGARRMIEEGLFERFPADAVFAIHNWPGLATGTIATRPGPIMAAYEAFEFIIDGHGCHAAMPHLGIDPILVGAQLVGAIQSIVSRKLDPLDHAVVSVTEFSAGDANSIIPERATLRGTSRSFKPTVSAQIEAELRRLGEKICEAHGAQLSFGYERHYPPTINDPAQAAFAAQVATELLGAEHVDAAP